MLQWEPELNRASGWKLWILVVRPEKDGLRYEVVLLQTLLQMFQKQTCMCGEMSQVARGSKNMEVSILEGS